MAISLGLMMKIIKPQTSAPVDPIQVETRKREKEERRMRTASDIAKNEGILLAALHLVGCHINDAGNSISNIAHIIWLHIWGITHHIALLFAIAALLGLAFCPDEPWTLAFAGVSFLLATWKGIHVHKSNKDGGDKGSLGVPIDPVPPD